MNLWPIKKFITYILKRSLGKFLKNPVDLNQYDFTAKKVTFKQLDINVQIINEALKDSPFKVISCNIGKLVILNPSLNLLTQKINVEISNVDIILMPIFSENQQSRERTSSLSSNEELDESQKKAKEEQQKSEEFNILNNLSNRILSNLEVKVTSLAIRILTSEVSESLDDIPTFLLRVNSLEFKRVEAINQENKPISDIQVILDGKSLFVSEISLHLMKSSNLYPDEYHPKNQLLSKLKFPFEYPLNNHPSTILLIKGFQTNINPKHEEVDQKHCSSMIIGFTFPKNPPKNCLIASVVIPNIEVMVSMKQIQGISLFSDEVGTYLKSQENLSKQQINIPSMVEHCSSKFDHETLDLYGTMIRTHSKNLIPEMKKFKSEQKQIKYNQLIGDKNQKKKKLNLQKDKWILKFIQKTQNKKEFEKLKVDLKQSIISHSQEVSSSIIDSTYIMQSMVERPKTKNLELRIDLQMPKISLYVECNEKGQEYDRMFDSICSQISANGQSSFLGVDEGTLRRIDHKIGYSYYNMEIRDITLRVTKQEVKSKGNPFGKSTIGQEIRAMGKVKQLQMHRYDLQNNLVQSDYSNEQYESLVLQSGIFKSTVEFYQLEEQKQAPSQQQMNKRGTHSSEQAQGKEELPNHNVFHVLTSVFRMNHQLYHFCKHTVLKISPCNDRDKAIMHLELSKTTNIGKQNQTIVGVGQIQVDLDWNDLIFLMQLKKLIDKDKNFKDRQQPANPQQQQSGNTKVVVECNGLNLQVHNYQIEEYKLIGQIIENKSIENIQVSQCLCQNQHIHHNYSLFLNLDKITANLCASRDISIRDLQVNVQKNGVTIPIIGSKDIVVNINEKQVEKQSNQNYHKQQSKPLIIYEEDVMYESSDEEGKKSDKSKEQQQLFQANISLKLSARTFVIDFDVQKIQTFSSFVTEFERQIKTLSIILDTVKCHMYDKYHDVLYETTQNQNQEMDQNQREASDKSEYFVGDEKVVQPLGKEDLQSIKVQLQFGDAQLIIRNTSNIQLAPQKGLLMKMRFKDLSFELLMRQQELQEKFKFDIKADDFFLLDYFQKQYCFHLELLKQQGLQMVQSFIPENFIALADESFQDELVKSQPFVIFYKQQVLSEKAASPSILNFQVDLNFKLVKKLERVATVGDLTELFYNLKDDSLILQFFEDLNQIKKNPMICYLDLQIQGLVLRLTQKLDLLTNLKFISDDFLKIVNLTRKKPKVAQSLGQQKDFVQFNLKLSDGAIDYLPVVTSDTYDRVFHNINEKVKKPITADEAQFQTSLRALLYIGEIQLASCETSGLQQQETQTIIAKNLSMSILQNNNFTDEYNPILLVDQSNCLDSRGGGSLIDQLGFVDLLSIDQIELNMVRTLITQDIIETQNLDIDEEEEQKQQAFDNEEEKEEDLFETSYGHTTMMRKIEGIRQYQQECLTVVVNKINLYIAKDSASALIKLGQIIYYFVEQLSKSKRSLNSEQRQARKRQRQQLLEDQQDSIQKLIEQFLFMDYDKQEEEAKLNEQDFLSDDKSSERSSSVKDSAYSESLVNLLSMSQQSEKQVFNMENAELQAVLIEEYIPELNEQNINENRHRYCHMLPSEFQSLFVKMKVHIEVHSVDFKLFEGQDYDFDKSSSLQLQQSCRESSIMSSSMFQQQKPRSSSELFTLNDDYLQGKNLTDSQLDSYDSFFKKSVSSKRPRLSTRGKYFQLCVKDIVFTMNELIDDDKKDNISRMCFSIKQLSLKETLSKPFIRNLIELPFSYQYDNQLEVILQKDIFPTFNDLSIRLKFQPFKLMLNQALITFFQDFFDIDFKKSQAQSKLQETKSNLNLTLNQSREDSKQSKPTYIKELKIYPFQAILTYTSKSLNLHDLTNGNIIEILNIFNIKDLELQIKKYDLKQRIRFEVAIKHLIDFYKEDFINNQKINFVKAIGPLKSTINIAGALYGVFHQPYSTLYNDESFIKGVGRGFYDLYSVVTQESKDLTSKVIGGVNKVKKAAKRL